MSGPASVIVDAGGAHTLDVNASGRAATAAPGDVSVGNSTTTPLGSGATFTGTWEDVSGYSAVCVLVKADQGSAASGLKFQWSADGATVAVESASNLTANQGRGFSITPRGRYFRVELVNGAVAQTSLRLAVVYSQTAIGVITRPLGDTIDDNNFAQLVRAIINAKRPNGSYGPLNVDASGNLQVIATPVSINAATGIVTGTIQLGGATAGTLNAIRATPYTEQTTNAQRSIRSGHANDSAAGTGARTVRITYLDAAGAGPFTEDVTLNGTTWVDTVATDICYIEKLEVITAGSGGTNFQVITLNSAAGGAGSMIGTIGVGNLVSARGDGRTFWAHHYIPAGKTASFATYIVSAESGGSGTNATFSLQSQVLPINNNAERVVSDLLLTVGALVRQLAIPIKVAGPARLTAYGVPAVNNAKLNASFDYSEE